MLWVLRGNYGMLDRASRLTERTLLLFKEKWGATTGI